MVSPTLRMRLVWCVSALSTASALRLTHLAFSWWIRRQLAAPEEFAAAPGTRQRLVSFSEGRSAQDSRARCTVTAEASSSGIRPRMISWSWSSRTEGRDAGGLLPLITRTVYVPFPSAPIPPADALYILDPAPASALFTSRREESKLADALSSTHPPRVPPPMAAYAPEHGRDLRSRLPPTTAFSLRLSNDGGLWRMRMWVRLSLALRDTGDDDGHGCGGGSRGSDIWSMLQQAGTTTAGAGRDTSSVAYGGAMTLVPAVRLPPALFPCTSRAFSVAVGVSIDKAARSEEALMLLLIRTSLAKVPTTTARTRPITVPSRSATLPVPHTTSNPPLSSPAVLGGPHESAGNSKVLSARHLFLQALTTRRSDPRPGRPATAPILASASRFRATFADPPSSFQDTRADPQHSLPFDSGMCAQDDPLPTALAAIRASVPMTWRFQLLVLALLRCSPYRPAIAARPLSAPCVLHLLPTARNCLCPPRCVPRLPSPYEYATAQGATDSSAPAVTWRTVFCIRAPKVGRAFPSASIAATNAAGDGNRSTPHAPLGFRAPDCSRYTQCSTQLDPTERLLLLPCTGLDLYRRSQLRSFAPLALRVMQLVPTYAHHRRRAFGQPFFKPVSSLASPASIVPPLTSSAGRELWLGASGQYPSPRGV
ncbi:hypothetical protein DFH09DRAFT_1327607 [Mycena vulgaris]|nr:hypothetical protein DFH09DRAFT_1327607 [Mycena vulgaris]